MSHRPPMTNSFTTFTGGVLLCGLMGWGATADAQSVAPGTAPGSVVDTAIADRDPLATSLRRIEPGNAQFSFESRLTVVDFNRSWSPFEPATPTATDPRTGLTHSQGYQFRSPGLRALIDRPEYVPLRNGGEAMIVPANTVFQLTLEGPTPAEAVDLPHENFMDQRVDLRVHRTPGASMLAFPQASIRDDRPMATLDLSQMRYPQLAAQAASTQPIPANRPTGDGSTLAAEDSFNESQSHVSANEDESAEPVRVDAEKNRAVDTSAD